MEFEKIKYVGNVLLKQIKSHQVDKPLYSDGPVERELYEGYRKNHHYGAIPEGKKYHSWALEYHLSPVRWNLLKWYPFDDQAELLEIGAGCGALTGLFCSKLKNVVSLEYSYQRALVTAQRYSNCSNLEVIAGGLQEYEENRLFDYITVIGVLEYAAIFYGGDKPFESFLKKVSTMLKPEGKLILAIENKIGLKYIAGAPEDHTGRIFESIYNYPSPSQVRTFSKRELAELLGKTGFLNLRWYYTLPDYKRVRSIISDEVTLKDNDSLWSLYSEKSSTFPRKLVPAERWFCKTLAHAGLFGEFSNSFLVIAKKTEIRDEPRCIRFWAANMGRKPKFRTNVCVSVSSGERSVIRSADNNEANLFIREIARRELLAEKFFKGKAEVVMGRSDGSSLHYKFIEYPSLYELISDSIEKGDTGFGKSFLEKYIRFLETLPQKECIPEQFMREFRLYRSKITKPTRCLTCAPFDCVPQNIRVGPQSWYIIDNEWTFDYPLPIDYLVFRGILTLIVGLQSYIKIYSSKNEPAALFRGYGKHREYIPMGWAEILKTLEIPLSSLMYWEKKFQNEVNVKRRYLRLRFRSKRPKVFTHLHLCKMGNNWGVMSRLKRRLSNIARLF